MEWQKYPPRKSRCVLEKVGTPVKVGTGKYILEKGGTSIKVGTSRYILEKVGTNSNSKVSVDGVSKSGL